MCRRIGNHCKAADHLSFDDIVVGASRRMLSLSGQNSEMIALKGNGSGILARWPVAVANRIGNQRTQGALGFARTGRPIKTILLARAASEFLSIFRHLPVGTFHPRIFALRSDDRAQCLDRVKLVSSDAPVQQLLFARRGVERPAIALANQREWKRKVIIADREHSLVRALHLER